VIGQLEPVQSTLIITTKAETMTGTVMNKVGIGRDTRANRKEWACHSLATWEVDNREW
jgi:hypothetical protein